VHGTNTITHLNSLTISSLYKMLDIWLESASRLVDSSANFTRNDRGSAFRYWKQWNRSKQESKQKSRTAQNAKQEQHSGWTRSWMTGKWAKRFAAGTTSRQSLRPARILANEWRRLSRRGVKLVTQFHLDMRLRTCAALLLLLYTPSKWGTYLSMTGNLAFRFPSQ